MTTTIPVTSAARRWASAIVLSASLLVITMDLTILNIAIPDLATDLEPSAGQLLWIVDAYSLVLAGLLISMSALGDRLGRKRLLITGYAIFALASAAVAVVDSAEGVIAIRAILGVGGAMIMPTTLSMMRAVFHDPVERAKALGLWAAVSGVGAGIGPIVGGFLLEHFSWHAAFIVNVPLMLVAVVAAAVILPESRVLEPGRWDVVGTVLSLAGMIALVWSIKRFAKEQTLADLLAWATLVGAVVLLVLFVVRCLRRPDPLVDMRLFRRPQFSAGIVAALGTTFALGAALLLLAQWVQVVQGASPIETGIRLLPAAVAGTVFSLVVPWLAQRLGARLVLAGGLAVAGLGMVILAIPPGDLTTTRAIVALVLVGAGIASLAVASAMIMSHTPDEKAGNAAALEETSYDLGNVLGVAILGSASAVLFKSGLAGDPSLSGLGPEVREHAQSSISSAIGVADELHIPELASAANRVFTDSLQTTGLIGGVIMFVVAAVVFVTTPKGTDISTQHH
ncbi:MFS transporter [Gordonia sp. SID5947]|nr:MFS transporter [Gordonia sp. SID5947]